MLEIGDGSGIEELLLDSEAWEGDEDLFLPDGTAEVERLLYATTTATRHACSQILVDAHSPCRFSQSTYYQ